MKQKHQDKRKHHLLANQIAKVANPNQVSNTKKNQNKKKHRLLENHLCQNGKDESKLS
jgi:hypothetical protein